MGSVGRTVGRVRPLTCPLSLKTVMETCSVLVLGDQAGGKTSLINRFLTGQYVATQLQSVSQAATHQKLHYVADTRLRFLIRELGEAREEDLKETDVVLLCFSLETSVSLARVVSHWSSVTTGVSIKTGKTPVLSRRNIQSQMEEQTVKIKVERLTRDKQ